MACCGEENKYPGYYQLNGCKSCNCEGNYTDFTCARYTGATLTCSGISTDDDGETILQKIDEALCSATGNYATYSMNCLPAYWNTAILNEATFVNAITSYICQLRLDYDTFSGTTYTNAINVINDTLNGVTNPNLTCSSAGVTNVDDLSDILTKYCTKFSSIDSSLSIDSVVWNNCFTVAVPPTTIAGGFQILADQICSVYSASSTLPTFDNTTSCLQAPVTSTDNLVDTINKMKTRLCLSPTYLASNITWGCITAPSSNTSIEVGLQSIVTKVGQIAQAAPTFNSGDFSIEATDPSDPCSGITVSLATPINQDRLFAVTTGDGSPGVFQNKVTAGTGISLDYISTPGQVIVNASGTADSYEVLASSIDDTPGYLIDKLNGSGSQGVTVSPSYNPSTKQVDLLTTVDLDVLFNLLLDGLDSNPTLFNKFCEKVRNCPSPCDAPTNVQAIAISTSTTTTTTEP